jgi:glycosyltransferase involved in cell wall biosynthesis
MRIVALLAVRNEACYLERCLTHLCEQGVETCLIDNESTDRTMDIVAEFSDRGVFRIESFPYKGIYEWTKILRFKSHLVQEINSDWFIHHDADEIREAPNTFDNLLDGIRDADHRGYNAINSDELVFMPVSEEQSFEEKDYVQGMQYYYYFKPGPLHRVNIWKKTDSPVDLVSSGGHCAEFAHRNIYPTNFILRHYILLSKKHALEKYGKRNYDPEELAKGMHVKRSQFRPGNARFPGANRLKKVPANGQWDLSEPWSEHFLF